MESRDDTLLSQRLSALALESPPPGGWDELRARMDAKAQAPSRRSASPRWFSLAAGVIGLALVLNVMRSPTPPLPAPPQSISEISALVQRSQSLEGEIRGLRANTPDLDEMRFALESAVESDLTVVDAQLASTDAPAEDLWRERVRLLEELKIATQMDTGAVLLQARLD